MARVPFRLPLDIYACQDGHMGTMRLHDKIPHKSGTLQMQFVTDIDNFNPIFSQEHTIQELFAALPDDLKVKAPKDDPNVAYKSAEYTVITRHIRPPTEDKPMNYVVIHEGRILNELAGKISGSYPNMWKFKGFITAKFDELPANKSERVVGVAMSPPLHTSLLQLVQSWCSGDASASLSSSQRKSIKKTIRKTLDKIHAAGYAHNDISPSSIGFEEDGTPILINFHACAKIGDHLDPAYIYPYGYVEWTGHHPDYIPVSSKEVDDYNFESLFDWLERTYDMDVFVARAA